MTDQEQIEEMVAVMAASNDPFVDVPIEIMPQVAKVLYNASYRKIPENAVVLSKEEFAELQKQVDELKKRLHLIWAIGVDYDGFEKSESLKELIDEMVELTRIESKDKE